jgi:hypothetical protein
MHNTSTPMPTKERKTASLGLRVTPRLKADLEAWARADGRTVTSLLYKILVEAALAYRAGAARPSRPLSSTGPSPN